MGLSSNHVSGNTVMASQQQQKCESEVPLRCPRCKSANTKFCYYNNYSKSQPRHYCRACRRHWTAGGVLRDVPVGGLRKSKRRRTSKPSPTADTTEDTSTASADLDTTVHAPLHHPTQFPPLDCDVAWFSCPPPSATVNVVESSAYDDMTNPFSSVSSSSTSGLSPCNLIGGLDEESLAAFDYWDEMTDLVTLEHNSSPIPGRIVEGSWIE
uniref:Dof zinc finger protein n=1 Tax=Ananas comosus var. bracteatus TaxID=296719 RepID=A0A6V7NR15_ANACO|nr:unnamed protein product [Ananas comosus var. bracteatus]